MFPGTFTPRTLAFFDPCPDAAISPIDLGDPKGQEIALLNVGLAYYAVEREVIVSSGTYSSRSLVTVC